MNLILEILNGSRRGLRITVSPSRSIILGRRRPEADIPLPDQSLSRAHCRISALENIFTIVDLNSANGTSVNKTVLHPNAPCPLRLGDLIEIGETLLSVRSDGQPHAPGKLSAIPPPCVLKTPTPPTHKVTNPKTTRL